jgi:hypothetical protein
MKKIYLLASVLFTFIFCLTIVFKTKPWPPKEKNLYNEFKSEKKETTWEHPYHNTPPITMKYYDVFNIETWEEYEAGKGKYISSNSEYVNLQKYNYEYFKDSNHFSGIITKERIFVSNRDGGDWNNEAVFFGVWNLKSNSTINVEWIAVNGGHSVGWFYSVYGKKSGWIALSGKSTFKPVLLKDNKKAYYDGYINYTVKDNGSFSNFLKAIFISFIVGIFMHRVQIMQLEAQERKARTKREAQEKKARTKREAQEKKARTTREAQERKARTKRKKDLIDKYGEKDGMLIFDRKISEKNYLKKKEKEKRKKELIEKYGKKFGEAVFNKKLLNGMSKAMVSESIGKPQYKDKDKWYHGNPFDRCIIFQDDKVNESNTLSEGLWLDMPKDMLIASYGKPEDEKKEVSKKGIKLKWHYGGRVTRQGSTAYSLEVRLENDLVVGWRELE